MYYGEAHSALDEKGRLAVPVQFRRIMDALDHDTWFITRGYDNSLFLFEKSRWEKLLQEELPKATLEPRKMDFRRFLVGSSSKIKLDGQGRLLIPQYLREYAGIDREGVLLGMEDHLQIWSETNWREYNQRQAAEYKKMAAELFGTHPFNAAEPKEEA
jgi:MraZ protein